MDLSQKWLDLGEANIRFEGPKPSEVPDFDEIHCDFEMGSHKMKEKNSKRTANASQAIGSKEMHMIWKHLADLIMNG